MSLYSRNLEVRPHSTSSACSRSYRWDPPFHEGSSDPLRTITNTSKSTHIHRLTNSPIYTYNTYGQISSQEVLWSTQFHSAVSLYGNAKKSVLWESRCSIFRSRDGHSAPPSTIFLIYFVSFFLFFIFILGGG